MSRRSYYSSFGSAIANHKAWLRAKEIEAMRKAEKEAKEKAEAAKPKTAETSNSIERHESKNLP